MSPASLSARLGAAWSRFWFRPADARTLGLMRALLGLVLVVPHLAMLGDLDLLYGAGGPVSLAAVAGDQPWSPAVTALFAATTTPGALRLVWLGGALAHLGVLFGVRGRLSLLASLAFQLYFYHRNPWCQHGGDRVLRYVTLYLLAAPGRLPWSWDARRAPVPAWTSVLPLRLIQIQVSVIYMHSGFVKGQGGTWHRGSALYYALSNRQYQRAPALLDALLPQPLVQAACELGTWVTLGWEAAFGLLMLWWPTRALGLAIGVLVHGGIFASMMVGSFSFVMVWCYLAFLPDGWPERLARWRARRRPGLSERSPPPRS